MTGEMKPHPDIPIDALRLLITLLARQAITDYLKSKSAPVLPESVERPNPVARKQKARR